MQSSTSQTHPTRSLLTSVQIAARLAHRGSFKELAATLKTGGFDVRPGTISNWLREHYKRFPAKAAWILSYAHDLGGLSFTRHPVIKDTDFRDLWRILSRTTIEVGINDSSLAKVLGLANGHYAKVYRTDPAYAERNLTVIQMDAWAQAVGFGHLALPPDPDKDSKRPAYPLELTPTLITAPVTPGVHASLCRLIRILSVERRLQGRELGSLNKVAVPDTLEAWEGQKLMFPSRTTHRDLTLGKLDDWARALGFGGVVNPQLGQHEWDDVLRALFDRVASLERNQRLRLRMRHLTVMWGTGWRKYRDLSWRELPAPFFEYLSVWAFGDGLALVSPCGHSGVDLSGKGWTPEQAQAVVREAGEALRAEVANRAVNDRPLNLREYISTYGRYDLVHPWSQPAVAT